MGKEIATSLFENNPDTTLEVPVIDTAAIAAAGDRRAYDPNERRSAADQEQRGNTYIQPERTDEGELAPSDLAVAKGLKGPALARAIMEARKKAAADQTPVRQPIGPDSPTIGAVRKLRSA